METKTENLILEKLGITKRGAMVILSNNELCERILNETPINIKSFCLKYEISQARINSFIDSGLISIFSNTTNQGSKKFVFENEALSFIKQINYKKSFNVKILNDISHIVISGSRQFLRGIDSQIIESIMIHGLSLEETALSIGLTRERTRQLYERALRKVRMSFRHTNNLQDLIQEKITIESELRVLRNVKKTIFQKQKKININQLSQFTTRLVDLDLSVRVLNGLKAAQIETLGDLVQFDKNEILKFRNFGKKSFIELEEFVEEMGLNFGMTI